MSVPVITTNSGAPHIEIAGLPVLPGDGKGGVPLERAAEVLSQLQDDNGEPLTGAALKAAAEDLIEGHELRIQQLSEAKVEKLPQLAGAFKDRPPAHEVAEQNYNELYGPLEAEPPGTPEQDLTTPEASEATPETKE